MIRPSDHAGGLASYARKEYMGIGEISAREVAAQCIWSKCVQAFESDSVQSAQSLERFYTFLDGIGDDEFESLVTLEDEFVEASL